MARKKPQPKWRAVLGWVMGHAGMIVGAIGLVSLIVSGSAWMAVSYTDNSRSDPPPRASIDRVEKVNRHLDRALAQMSKETAQAIRALSEQNALTQQRQAANASETALGLCQLYRPQAATAAALVAKDPTDARAQVDAAFYRDLAAKYCGQALAAPAP